MKKGLLLLTISLCIALVGCSTQTEPTDNSQPENKQESGTLETVSMEEFAQAMEDDNVTVIDLRTPEELKETGIIDPNAISIDVYDADYEEQLQALDKNAKYLIYCRSGNRSGRTLELMKELGFKNILNLEKGIASWKDAGREVFTWEEGNKTGTDELRIITIDAKRFEFSPNEIRVKQGENVALQINDIDRDHGALIADMEVYYEANDNIILDTSKTGTYEFACATVCGGGHRDMKGIIIVE